MSRRTPRASSLPDKANKILNSILVVLLLIALKVWYLSIIQHEKKQEEALKPQRRLVLERSERATIHDRFHLSLATNKVQYNAFVSYGPIRELPRSRWKKDERGKRMKYPYRKEYIHQLSCKLAEELHLDAEWIEDLIHSQAAILGNVPCLLQENISEKQYFRLKILEQAWPGICAEIGARRYYPWGEVASDLIGYIGPISRREYQAITEEMRHLREIVNGYEEGEQESAIDGYWSVEKATARLEELERRAYHINDFVGKMGVEASYDKELRGMCGKRLYLTDTKGNFLSELPGFEKPVSGSQLQLTISAELQEYAQQLLAEYESELSSGSGVGESITTHIPDYQPWIKGGAIIAMHPCTGEIYAMASSPTFDPNDFIRTGVSDACEKNQRVERWLETESHLSSIWNMSVPYTRMKVERDYVEEKIELSWENYLRFILPPSSPVRRTLLERGSVADAVWVQEKIEELGSCFDREAYPSLDIAKVIEFIYALPDHKPIGITLTLPEKEYLAERCAERQEEIHAIQVALAPYFSPLPLNYDKVLLVDLYRLSLVREACSPLLLQAVGEMPLSVYREASARFVSVSKALRVMVQEIFLDHDFKQWRAEQFGRYLAERRKEEKEANLKHPRPYLEYLATARKNLFDTFWDTYQWDFFTLFLTGETRIGGEEMDPYLEGVRRWRAELLAGAHQGLPWVYPYHRFCSITERLGGDVLIAFLRTLRSFEQLERPLLGRYVGLRGMQEKDLAAAFYPKYGFGFARSHAFRQATTIGSIFKLVTAYEALRQKYVARESQPESSRDLNPLTIIDDKHRVWGKKAETWNVGYTVDGRPIPRYYRGGLLPRTEHAGVGKVDLVRALAASSNPYFALLAGDVLEDPEDVCTAANLLGFGEKTEVELPGEYGGYIPKDVAYNRTGLYAMTIGQHSLVGTPLQTAVMLSVIANGGAVVKPQIVKSLLKEEIRVEKPAQIRWQVCMPPPIQDLLLTGLRQVVMGDKGTARRLQKQGDPELVHQIVGKTSTAEVIEKMSLDSVYGNMKLKHVGFGGIAYTSADFSTPELVVVIYLRYGGWGGKDAAPLALEMVKKWREIKKKYRMVE